MNMKNSNKRSTEWVKRLPAVVSALNNEVTRLIGKLSNQREIRLLQTRHTLLETGWLNEKCSLPKSM